MAGYETQYRCAYRLLQLSVHPTTVTVAPAHSAGEDWLQEPPDGSVGESRDGATARMSSPLQSSVASCEPEPPSGRVQRSATVPVGRRSASPVTSPTSPSSSSLLLSPSARAQSQLRAADRVTAKPLKVRPKHLNERQAFWL